MKTKFQVRRNIFGKRITQSHVYFKRSTAEAQKNLVNSIDKTANARVIIFKPSKKK